jgi:hypothetical protein
VLCGKKGKKIICKIMTEPCTYIGDEWETFCLENDFKLGDFIRSKFTRADKVISFISLT